MLKFCLTKICAAGKYSEALTSGILNKSMQETENNFRGLFARNRDHPALNDPHLLLWNLYSLQQDIAACADDKEEVNKGITNIKLDIRRSKFLVCLKPKRNSQENQSSAKEKNLNNIGGSLL
jgi:hypothetical protein